MFLKTHFKLMVGKILGAKIFWKNRYWSAIKLHLIGLSTNGSIVHFRLIVIFRENMIFGPQFLTLKVKGFFFSEL